MCYLRTWLVCPCQVTPSLLLALQKMPYRIYSTKRVEPLTGEIPKLPHQISTEIFHSQPSNSKDQVLFPTHVLLSVCTVLFLYMHCFNFIFCRSGLALGSGLFPICQKGAKELFGVGCGLIHSILETPKAPSHPHPFRIGVPGISTFPKQNAQTTPLFSKGDIVER